MGPHSLPHQPNSTRIALFNHNTFFECYTNFGNSFNVFPGDCKPSYLPPLTQFKQSANEPKGSQHHEVLLQPSIGIFLVQFSTTRWCLEVGSIRMAPFGHLPASYHQNERNIEFSVIFIPSGEYHTSKVLTKAFRTHLLSSQSEHSSLRYYRSNFSDYRLITRISESARIIQAFIIIDPEDFVYHTCDE